MVYERLRMARCFFPSFPISGPSSRSRAASLPESSYLLGEGGLTNFGKEEQRKVEEQ